MHIQNFKNLNQIAKAKGEMINNIIHNGTMIINMDDKYYKYFLKKLLRIDLKSLLLAKKIIKLILLFWDRKKIKILIYLK